MFLRERTSRRYLDGQRLRAFPSGQANSPPTILGVAGAGPHFAAARRRQRQRRSKSQTAASTLGSAADKNKSK